MTLQQPVVSSVDEHDHSRCLHAAGIPESPAPAAIDVRHVTFSYRSSSAARFAAEPVLRDVSLRVDAGMNLGIIGPNGAGKTTLLRLMLGLLQGHTGTIRMMGLSPIEACRRGDIIGYVPQRSAAEWRFPITARQVVRLGLIGKTGFLRRFSADDLDYAEQMMHRVGVHDVADRPAGDLSGGQQQRLYIARALAPRPRILILDEPMSGIDVRGQREIGALIRELHRTLDLTVVVVSHDVEALAAGCTRVACLRNTIHYHDAPQGLTPRILSDVFQHGLDAVFGGDFQR